MTNLLARYAETVFWLARHIERAENLARVLDVNESFSHDTKGDTNWESILRLYADEKRFYRKGRTLSADSVIRYYVIDHDNPGSVVSSLRMARENARTLRPLISTEMWTQLNMFYHKVEALKDSDLAEPKLNELCRVIKEGCQAHGGITNETFYRDEGWFFYQLGMNIERADQTSRLLDVKYELLLPSVSDVGSPLDLSQWNALLRSTAGYHAYRRIHPSGINPAKVAGFLLLDTHFPRSVAASIGAAARMLVDLRYRYGLAAGAAAENKLLVFQSRLGADTIEAVIARGLHEELDWIQRELIAVTNALGRDFFGSDEAEAPAA